MSTDKVKASPFNPVDHMETDEEIIEFIVDCYDEDPEGRVYLRACQFLGDSRGPLKTYEILQRATREIASRNQQPSLSGRRREGTHAVLPHHPPYGSVVGGYLWLH